MIEPIFFAATTYLSYIFSRGCINNIVFMYASFSYFIIYFVLNIVYLPYVISHLIFITKTVGGRLVRQNTLQPEVDIELTNTHSYKTKPEKQAETTIKNESTVNFLNRCKNTFYLDAIVYTARLITLIVYILFFVGFIIFEMHLGSVCDKYEYGRHWSDDVGYYYYNSPEYKNCYEPNGEYSLYINKCVPVHSIAYCIISIIILTIRLCYFNYKI